MGLVRDRRVMSERARLSAGQAACEEARVCAGMLRGFSGHGRRLMRTCAEGGTFRRFLRLSATAFFSRYSTLHTIDPAGRTHGALAHPAARRPNAAPGSQRGARTSARTRATRWS